MVRGGQREGAGRKSTWTSGAKFEDTTVIRVPKNIKDKVSAVAYKLDAGEDIDLDSNSKIQELESKLLLLQLDNELLVSQLQNKSLDLETQSKKIQELEQENNQLRNSLNSLNQLEKQLVTNSKEELKDLVTKSESHTQPGLFDVASEDNSTFINELEANPLQGKLLAKRLGIKPPDISVRKGKLSPELFYDWLQSKDPNGIRWVSLGGSYSKGYVPADNTPVDKLQLLEDWLQANT
jgi:hypothetical protein